MRTIPEREALTVEFKSDRTGLSDGDLIDAVVGMTNTKGGDLFIGVEDDGTLSGARKQHLDVYGVSAMIANRTVPPIAVRAEIISESDIPVLHLEIPMSRAVVASSDGRILRRRLKVDGSPESVPFYPYEINTRLSYLGLQDFSAQAVAGAVTEDFDPAERDKLRSVIQLRGGDTSLLELDDEDFDKALGFVKREDNGLHPTITGLLMIGRSFRLKELLPTATACFQVLEGSKVRVNEEYCKPLVSLLEILEAHMKAWNPERETDYGLLRVPVPEFSPTAFREGIVNAFAHRDYSILQPVRIAVEDDGLTICSPGGFIDGIDQHNLLSAEPHGRNPLLADTLKRLGLAERTGRGIDRIFAGSIVCGRPWPDYSESTSRSVRLFIQRAAPDIFFMRMIREAEQKERQTLSINSLMILSLLRTKGALTADSLSSLLSISISRVQGNLERLVSCGLVAETGSRKYSSYVLKRGNYSFPEKDNGTMVLSDSAIARGEDLIMKLVMNNGMVRRDDAARFLGISNDQAYRILKKMVIKGSLKLQGKGRYAYYVHE